MNRVDIPTVLIYPSQYDHNHKCYKADLFNLYVLLDRGQEVDGDLGGKALAGFLFTVIGASYPHIYLGDFFDERLLQGWLDKEGVTTETSTFDWRLKIEPHPIQCKWFICNGQEQLARFWNFCAGQPAYIWHPDAFGLVVGDGASNLRDAALTQLVICTRWDAAKLIIGGAFAWGAVRDNIVPKLQSYLSSLGIRLLCTEDPEQWF